MDLGSYTVSGKISPYFQEIEKHFIFEEINGKEVKIGAENQNSIISQLNIVKEGDTIKTNLYFYAQRLFDRKMSLEKFYTKALGSVGLISKLYGSRGGRKMWKIIREHNFYTVIEGRNLQGLNKVEKILNEFYNEIRSVFGSFFDEFLAYLAEELQKTIYRFGREIKGKRIKIGNMIVPQGNWLTIYYPSEKLIKNKPWRAHVISYKKRTRIDGKVSPERYREFLKRFSLRKDNK